MMPARKWIQRASAGTRSMFFFPRSDKGFGHEDQYHGQDQACNDGSPKRVQRILHLDSPFELAASIAPSKRAAHDTRIDRAPARHSATRVVGQFEIVIPLSWLSDFSSISL